MRLHVRRIAKLTLLSVGFVFLLLVFVNQFNEEDTGGKSVQQVLFKLDNATSRTVQADALLRSPRDVREANKSAKLKKGDAQMYDHIFISVKTTGTYHDSRIRLLLETWISIVKNQTYIFTDIDDTELIDKHGSGRVINTGCPSSHYRKSLVCKMSHEFDWFINSKKQWFCHVDDDTYLNMERLLDLLQQYNHTDDWYLGRPSLAHPIEVEDRSHPGQKVAFWFATGAGFCISRALALKMVPYAGGGRLQRSAEQIRLPDDCTIGYIIESLLHKQLTVINTFHSHLEALWKYTLKDIKDQITLSYSIKPNRENIVNIPGFPKEKDPTRFRSIHCHLYPHSDVCLSGDS